MAENFESTTKPDPKLNFSLSELISQAKNIIDILTNLKQGTVNNSEGDLQNYIEIAAKLKEQYLKEGTDGILKRISNAVERIQTFITKSKEISDVLNIDISDCLKDKDKELEKLGENLIKNFTESAETIIKKSVDKIQSNAKIVNDISEEINNLPSELSKNLISWNPKPYIDQFIARISELASKIPEQISNIITEATDLVNTLPDQLVVCVTEAVKNAENDAHNIVKNIATSIGSKFSDAIVDYLLHK